jgi:hypothetical protein
MAAIGDTLNKRLDIHDDDDVTSLTWEEFSKTFEKAYIFYEDDKIDECVKQCREILRVAAGVPRYIHICTLVLLALVAKDEEEFRTARIEDGMSILPSLCIAC